jgi:hypothetical protein
MEWGSKIFLIKRMSEVMKIFVKLVPEVFNILDSNRKHRLIYIENSLKSGRVIGFIRSGLRKGKFIRNLEKYELIFRRKLHNSIYG